MTQTFYRPCGSPTKSNGIGFFSPVSCIAGNLYPITYIVTAINTTQSTLIPKCNKQQHQNTLETLTTHTSVFAMNMHVELIFPSEIRCIM